IMAFVLFMFITKEIRTMKQVKSAIEALDSIDQHDTNIDQKLNDIFQSLNKSRYKKLWERYYNRVKKKDEDEKIKVDSFFSEDVLYHQMGYRSWMDLGAGISVSIGVLGTFIGLSAGLSDLNVGNTDALRTGIGALLDGMKVAFYTSVFG